MKNFIKTNISQDSLALLLVHAPIAMSMLIGDDFVIKVLIRKCSSSGENLHKLSAPN